MSEGTTLNPAWPGTREAPERDWAIDEAVERAVLEHSRLVYRVAFAVLRNREDAEDATQEVYLRVLRLRRDLDGVRDPRPWLARIAFRVAVDRRPRRGAVSLDDEAAGPAFASLRDPSTGADDRAASAQARLLLRRAIDALPAELRHTVQLSTLEELNSAEVGHVLGIPEGTVRTRLLRARALLRSALAPVLGVRHA